MTTSAALPREGIYYPERDGKPMGETDTHRRVILETIFAL